MIVASVGSEVVSSSVFRRRHVVSRQRSAEWCSRSLEVIVVFVVVVVVEVVQQTSVNKNNSQKLAMALGSGRRCRGASKG